MKTEELNFHVSSDLRMRAPPPAAARGDARLLVLRRATGALEHRRFVDLPELLAGDAVYVNDSAVYRGRVLLRTGRGHPVPADLFKKHSDARWEGYLRAAAHLTAPGQTLTLPDGAPVAVVETRGPRHVVEFATPPDRSAWAPVTPASMEPPETPADWPRYECVYARAEGTGAVPSAGYHLTPALLAALDVRYLTLHTDATVPYAMTAYSVGYHEEFAADEPYAIPRPPAPGESVCAVGTTVAKALETWARTGEPEGASSLFIHPPFEWRVATKLLTNFPFPGQSFVALHAAFGGVAPTLAAYAEAARERYRWYTYGDGLLIC